MPKISILTASLASMVCMLALFAVAALAAGPVPQTAAHGKPGKARQAPQGVCFLHGLF
jgi:hypothetical protein